MISTSFAEKSSINIQTVPISKPTVKLFPVYDKELIGFIDSTGATIIKPQFSVLINDTTIRYMESATGTKMPSVLPYYFKEGKLILGQSEVYSLLKHGNHYSIINEAGQIETEMIFEWVGEFSEGFAPVCKARTFLGIKIGEKWGTIDHSGQVQIEP